MAKQPPKAAKDKPAAGDDADVDKLVFSLHLPDGPNNAVLIIAGGADVNRDDKISNKDEVSGFDKKAGNIWTREQPFDGGKTKGMLFAVTMTIGGGVKWELTITKNGNEPLYSGKNTTIFVTETVSYHFD